MPRDQCRRQGGTCTTLIHKICEPGHHSNMAFVMAMRRRVRAHSWPFGNMSPVPEVTDADLVHIIRFIREVQVANGIM